jgi:hypothetical protein
MAEARDRDGEPRAALVVPPSSARCGKRPVILLFGSLAAAIAAKRDMEGAADARRSRVGAA